MFYYIADIKYVQIYELPDTRLCNKFGNIVSEREYQNGMYIPNIGSKLRFDNEEMKGIYEVKDIVFNDSTGVLRIKVKKTVDVS